MRRHASERRPPVTLALALEAPIDVRRRSEERRGVSKKSKGLPPNLTEWVEARARYHLSDAAVQMARELGMNPKKLGGKANSDQERWKAPLPDFIADLYEKRFGLRCPAVVTSIEASWEASKIKHAQKKAAKEERRRERAVEVDRLLGFANVAEVRLHDGAVRIEEGDLNHRLSDALLTLMKPFVTYPPAEQELPKFEAALKLGATVWNASLIPGDEDRAAAFDEIARLTTERAGGSADASRSFVAGIAARKRELFPSDERRVGEVRVEAKGRNVLITAMSILGSRSRA